MQSGQIVAGKYRLNQVLGTGGMAEVWSATNTFTERQLAIKFMNKDVGKASEAAARFLKEAKVSARINHPNVIEIHDVGQTEEGQLFLVMELLTGFPLEVALKRQTPPMSLYEFALVMLEVAQALDAAHKVGIVHRDLKPTNIFLHKIRDGVAIPKLLDFGVSKFLEDVHDHALTMAGTVLGSPLYMSPEQARGEASIDGRSDVFAFGAILFEALSGFRAYEAKNFNALIVKIATSKPKSIDECAPHAPESLRAVVRACLETDLARRAQSFEEVVRLLREALPELGESEVRLPVPLTSAFPVDPDATNALPVLRASDRPPPVAPSPVTPSGLGGLGPLGTPRRSAPPPAATPSRPPAGAVAIAAGSVPVGATGLPTTSGPTGPSWHTPNPLAASLHVAATSAPTRPAVVALGAAVSLLAVLGLATGLLWRSRATAVESRAATSAAVAAPPRTGGELVVTAQPGACVLFVDGTDRGPTPVKGLALGAGAHQLECRTPKGAVKSATTTVHDGAVTRYKFLLDD